MSDMEKYQRQLLECEQEIGRGIIGQREVIRQVLLAFLAGGNVLLEGMPGLGKTMLVRTISQVFLLSFKRIQFTPDLMPSDVTGTNIMVKKEGDSSFRFERGPIFAHLVLADEINRATPKTQSALLEAMQEHTVTVGTESHRLEEPFLVLATQNPIEQEGTYPLPEAQLDRFLFKVLVGFPSLEAWNRKPDRGAGRSANLRADGAGGAFAGEGVGSAGSDCRAGDGLYPGARYGDPRRKPLYPGGRKPPGGAGHDPYGQSPRFPGGPAKRLL